MNVLIADDEAISRRLLQNYLTKWEHTVTVAEDGAQAWELFQSGDFHMVISDWMMPGMDGPDFIRLVRAHDNAAPGYVYAILLTAKTHKEDLVAGMEAGADDFITKPFDRDELRVRVHQGERIINLERRLAEQSRSM